MAKGQGTGQCTGQLQGGLPDFVAGNQLRVLLAILTNVNITGTSTSTPTTVANAAPDCRPKREIATATANSKKLLAPIIPAGAATSWGIFHHFAQP